MKHIVIIDQLHNCGQKLKDYVDSMHTFLNNKKHVAYMNSEELSYKEMIERGQAAAQGILHDAERIKEIIFEFHQKYGKDHEELIKDE